jgi:UDP-N-acetylmuramoyl-L-alanyl-D-glutamate--2,6-diaminopimelate ligase
MASAGLKYAVIEASSHGLVQHRTADIDFKVGVLTNLSPEHLDYHSTMDEYRAAKGKLFEQIPEDGAAVLNGDDPSSDFFSQITNARVIRYGREGDMKAEDVTSELGNTALTVKGLDMDVRIETPLTGKHNVQNILAACCACRALEVPSDTIVKALSNTSPVPGRLELVKNDLDRTVLIDYAHTSRALRCILEEIKPLCDGRLIVVFGCGGDRDTAKRPLMGKAAEELADEVWVTSDNPRTEDPSVIIEEILAGMSSANSSNIEADRETAIRRALESAGADDTVLIAGKGHEKFQLIGDAAIPFDDREVTQRIVSDIKKEN